MVLFRGLQIWGGYVGSNIDSLENSQLFYVKITLNGLVEKGWRFVPFRFSRINTGDHVVTMETDDERWPNSHMSEPRLINY